MNPDGEDVIDLNPKRATGSLEYVGGQPAQYCLISMGGGRIAVSTDMRLTSTIEAILEERNWADTKSTAANFTYVTVKGIKMIHSIQSLTKWVVGVGNVSVDVPQPLVPIKADLRRFITHIVSTPDASFSTVRTSKRFEESATNGKEISNDSSTHGDSGVSDASSMSVNVSDPPSEHKFPGPQFLPSSTITLKSDNCNAFNIPRKEVPAKQINLLAGSSVGIPKPGRGNAVATGFPAFGTRNSTFNQHLDYHPRQPSLTADQEFCASKDDQTSVNIASSSHLFAKNDSTIGNNSNPSGAKFSFAFPKSTANSGLLACNTREQASSAKQFPGQSPSTSSSPPSVFPRSSENYTAFTATLDNRINMSEQSPDSDTHTNIVRPSANLEDNSLKSKFRKIDKDIHNCDEALLHKIQNEWYYEPYMLNKLDYPFTTGGFIDKRNFTGATVSLMNSLSFIHEFIEFTFYSRRTGHIEIADTEERKRKNAIYGYCMVMGPRNCTAWEFAKPPSSFKSTKFLKRGQIEVKGYGILAAAGERNERNWLLWSDHLGLISCLPSAGRNIKGKYKDWTPTLQAVMFDAEEEGQWKVKNLAHVEYETMSKNKWFPDHIYFVNDVVKQITEKGDALKFYSNRLRAEINVRIKENVIDSANDGRNFEAFVVFDWHTPTEGEFFALAVYPPRYRTSDEHSIFQKLLPHVHIVENWETDNVKCTPMENNARSRL